MAAARMDRRVEHDLSRARQGARSRALVEGTIQQPALPQPISRQSLPTVATDPPPSRTAMSARRRAAATFASTAGNFTERPPDASGVGLVPRILAFAAANSSPVSAPRRWSSVMRSSSLAVPLPAPAACETVDARCACVLGRRAACVLGRCAAGGLGRCAACVLGRRAAGGSRRRAAGGLSAVTFVCPLVRTRRLAACAGRSFFELSLNTSPDRPKVAMKSAFRVNPIPLNPLKIAVNLDSTHAGRDRARAILFVDLGEARIYSPASGCSPAGPAD